jgi:arylsulfatase
MGSALGGFSLYLRDGRVRYVHNLYGKERTVISSDTAIGPGRHEVRFEFTKTAEYAGRGALLLDGVEVGAGDIGHFTPVRFSIAGSGLTCGYELGPAIGDDYVAPFPCTAVIERVEVDVSGARHRDPEGEFQAIMAEQ